MEVQYLVILPSWSQSANYRGTLVIVIFKEIVINLNIGAEILLVLDQPYTTQWETTTVHKSMGNYNHTQLNGKLQPYTTQWETTTIHNSIGNYNHTQLNGKLG